MLKMDDMAGQILSANSDICSVPVQPLVCQSVQSRPSHVLQYVIYSMD